LLEAKLQAREDADDWLTNAVTQRLRDGTAYLAVLGPRPDLLAGIPLERIISVHGARARCDAALAAVIANGQTNASAIPFVTTSWASEVFPDQDSGAAEHLLWSALCESLGCADAVQPAERAPRLLQITNERRARMQRHAFRALRLTGPAIRLTIGLAEGHVWRGGREVSSRGIAFTPTLPGVAIYTATDPASAEGTVAFARSISVAGVRVEGLEVYFQAGAAVRVTANRGQRAFERLLGSDHGAGRIGQIGLIDVTAPLAKRAINYHNPMLDGAAAPHLAFGTPSPGTFHDVKGAGAGNRSAIHIDAMFDATGLAVDGIDVSGTAHAVMRNGAFVL
jgi:aminopeptidase